MTETLRTAIVIDYQNVHLTGRDLFAVSRHRPPHESLVDPFLFAGQLITTRNNAQNPGYAHAVLAKVLVYRGQPSQEHDTKSYDRNQAQKAHWEHDPRVSVTLRPLKYEFQRDGQGQFLRTSTASGLSPPSERRAWTSCVPWHSSGSHGNLKSTSSSLALLIRT